MAKKRKKYKSCGKSPVAMGCDFAKNDKGILAINTEQEVSLRGQIVIWKTEIELDYNVFNANPFTMW